MAVDVIPVELFSLPSFHGLHCKLAKIALFIAGPIETRNPSLDSDQWIGYYVCAPRL